ncbi:alpha-(1,3)-fucosyltransferase [Plakobranchus ocellatus]|uniref:Fucosyltransferase n=1 Tax=Plakobranchus ocellatus TaxID=259542 RepID=A0AAV4A1Q2_9GAST|nr:alpha-(1,3)-fucosyltransferase [Plakobranchus ocellatus]
MRRSVVMITACGLLGAWCFTWLLLSYPLYVKKSASHTFPQVEQFSVVGKNAEKIILFYDFPSYYELENVTPPPCSRKCKFSANSSQARSADAVIVFSHDHILGRTSIDLTKSMGQTWVFFAVESPPYSNVNSLGHAKFRQKFNWTMTYRQDSDIFFGYFKMKKKSTPASSAERSRQTQERKQLFAKKSKMVAWFVSHCETDSKREIYVNELKKYIQVDVYGACGKLQCGTWPECDAMVSKDYKFYLSFENTLCKDYISEKLLKILQQQATVPVVRGGANYKALCPPDSVVNAADFPSPKALAEHLKKLASDEAAYLKMLQWSWDYEVVQPILPLCELCERLYKSWHTQELYEDVAKWWTDGTCHPPRDL